MEPFLATSHDEVSASFSPNGRWIAYDTSESGPRGMFFRPLCGPGGPWAIGFGECPFPSWSRDGRTLYYLSAGRGVMEVLYSVQSGAFVAEEPRAWYSIPIMQKGTDFAMSPDGKRAIVVVEPNVPSGQEGNVHVTFLQNFYDELRRRIPR